MSRPATYASNGFYLYLSSVDSVDYFPSNTSDNFIVKLPEVYKLPGHWEVALTEIHFPARAGQTAESFSVYSDICEETVTRGIKEPVLRKLFNTTDEATFAQYYYIPVRSKEISSIRIFIKSTDGEPVSFRKGTLHCTLHMRKTDDGGE